jgi:cholesterol transport system auxiliary component
MSAKSIGLNRRHLFLASGATLALAGCAGGGNKTQIYVLRPDLPTNPAGPKVKWELTVAMPYAAGSLNSERIALTRTTSTLDFFADSAWTDQLPVLLQNCLIETFEKSGRIAAVSRETAGLKAAFVLETEVRDFAAHYENAVDTPEIVVRIAAKLVALPERTIVGTLDSLHRANAAENKVPAIVSAFNVALTASLNEIVNWTLAAPPAALISPPAPATPARRKRRRRRRRQHA